MTRSSLVILLAACSMACGSSVMFDGTGGAGGQAGGTGSGNPTTGVTGSGVTSGVTTSGVTGVGGASSGVSTTTGTTTTTTGAGPTTVTTVTSGAGGMGPATVTTTSGPSVTSTVTTTSGAGGGMLCPHDVCTEGPPLHSSCGSCEGTVCTQDPYCCNAWWDSICVQEANQLCMANCPYCPHDVCTTGLPLTPACDPCVAQVCAQDPTCCSTSWDGGCIQLVGSVCNISCP